MPIHSKNKSVSCQQAKSFRSTRAHTSEFGGAFAFVFILLLGSARALSRPLSALAVSMRNGQK